LALLLVSCASPNAPADPPDLAMLLLADLAGSGRDGMQQAMPDLSTGDGPVGPCTLGDADHCGTCSTVCPPGMDTAGTKRTCSMPTAFGTCGYICRGEFYELDGMSSNGCEAEDLPIQDTTTTAVTVNLPNGHMVTGNPSNLTSQIYGDDLEHETSPVMRTNGREDWFKLMITGQGATDRGPTACLGITSFPADNVFEVCLSAKGAASFLPAGCKTMVKPASTSAERCVQQPDGGAGETGTYYARVRRVSGTWSANDYALFLEH
jgi:hypothetical protein